MCGGLRNAGLMFEKWAVGSSARLCGSATGSRPGL